MRVYCCSRCGRGLAHRFGSGHRSIWSHKDDGTEKCGGRKVTPR